MVENVMLLIILQEYMNSVKKFVSEGFAVITA